MGEVNVLCHLGRHDVAGRCVDGQAQGHQQIIDFIVVDCPVKVGQAWPERDGRQPAWEIADVSGIIIFFNVLSGTGNRYAVQQLKKVKVQCFQQSVRGALISGELAPRIESGLRLTEDFVNALGGVKLFVDLCSVSLIGKGKLVFQVDKFVVDRRCGEHQHLCPNSGTDHSVEQF